MIFRREKVKRRKERGRREGDDEPKKKEDEQQKPDLTKLSAHLPSGWQVSLLSSLAISVAFCFAKDILKLTLSSLSLAGLLGRIYQENLLWEYSYI